MTKGNEMEGKNEVMVLEVPSDDMYICTNINEGQLPAFLEEAVQVVDIPAQQDMLLLADLTAISYALPHIKMLHNNGSKEYSYWQNCRRDSQLKMQQRLVKRWKFHTLR